MWLAVLRIRIRCLFDPWIRDGFKNPDPGSGHFSERLETVFWVKILKFFEADPGWKKFRSTALVAGKVEALFDYGVHRIPLYLHYTLARLPPSNVKKRSRQDTTVILRF